MSESAYFTSIQSQLKSFLPFTSNMLDPSLVRVLNQAQTEDVDEKIDPIQLSKSLHHKILKLKGKFLSDDGASVDYEGMRGTKEFEEFEIEARQLHFTNLKDLNEMELKVFFINLYNALTMHALGSFVKLEKTVLELDKFWQKNAYKIQNFIFSLDDMEHGVLRGNQLHPTYKEYFFKEGDPRRDFVLTDLDHRIHFALNCGAKSCPPIRLFTTENIDQGLNLAAKNFCKNNTQIDILSRKVTLSKIFMWYGGDFGLDNDAILKVLKEYLPEEEKVKLDEILDENILIEFADYDWSID